MKVRSAAGRRSCQAASLDIDSTTGINQSGMHKSVCLGLDFGCDQRHQRRQHPLHMHAAHITACAALPPGCQGADEQLLQVPAGGFKLWEGALDLCQYLIQRYGLQHLCKDSSSSRSAAAAGSEASSSGSSSLQGKAVIELGCGHGLPGIVAALGGASKVHFQVRAGGSCCC
jgi:hypothetical protein